MNLSIIARILHYLRKVSSIIRVFITRQTGATIGRGVELNNRCDLYLGSSSKRCGRLVIGDDCELEPNVILWPYGGEIRLMCNVHVGPGTVIYGHGGVSIGNNTLLSMGCRILSSNHTIPPQGIDIRSQPNIPLATQIGSDVWLGAGAIVLGGVTIGDGCVVGAGAVVNKSLAPGSIAVGVPAKVIGQRPTEETGKIG